MGGISSSGAGLPDLSRHNIPKREKINHPTAIYTKWLNDLSNGHNLYQLAINYAKLLNGQIFPKCTKICIFGTIWQPWFWAKFKFIDAYECSN
jgi:hypothetical protein